MDYRIIVLILGFLFAILPISLLAVIKKKKTLKIVYFVLAILYVCVVCVGVLTNIHIGKTIYILPFGDNDIIKNFDFSFSNISTFDYIINILMFVPLGFLLYSLFKKYSLIKVTLIGLLFSCTIEILQLVLPIVRGAQISDIVLNTLSCLIGALCFTIFQNISILTKRKNSH